MPKVSVILTSYNHAAYIREAIDSVLNQSYQDFELIIWDDASTDSSWDIIQQYENAKVKCFRNDVNLGPIVVVNNAITQATGDYIAIHHSDDAWELNKLEKQVDFLEANPEVGAVFTWAKIIGEYGEEIKNDYFTQENKSRWQWLQQLFTGDNRLNHPSILIRKQCYQDVGLYRYDLAQTPDAEMWSRLLLKFPIHIIQEKLTKHRLCSDNSNTSGYRIDVKIRASNEWNIIRENFLSLTHFDDIVAIFPHLERYRNPAGYDNKFLLAMACLYECKQRNAWQLGLTWLFELLNDHARCQKIAELYAFSYADLIKLTAQFDVYRIESVSLDELQAKIENLQESNAWLESQCTAWENTAIEREQFIKDLQSSNTWLTSQRTAWENTAIEREQFINDLQNTAIEREQFINDLQNTAIEREQFIKDLESQRSAWENIATERYTLINNIYASHSWKITRPMRFFIRLIHNPKLLFVKLHK
jgi:glycosyltransferase involved in cell wall biosynthesis